MSAYDLCTLEIGDNLAAILDHIGQIVQPVAIAVVGIIVARLHGTIKRATTPTGTDGSRAVAVTAPPTPEPAAPAPKPIEDIRNKPIL